MSRVSLIEQLYAPKKKSALEFNYDALWAPPIRFFLSQQDINELYKIATSLKYNDNIEKKYELIDTIMRPRGFKRGNCGTNRVVYNFLEDTSFCMKIALDRVGIHDSPKEYKNQEFFKPFCCKIFEVDPTGVIACVERVNPISSLEEFASIADDVFNMMITKIIGKYVVDDLGTEKFMNYGIRYNSNGIAFGPVVLDYPYAYELDGAKLHCNKPIQIGNKEFACGGEIDYDAGLNNLVCCKCGRHYSARELAKDDSNVLKFYSDDDNHRMRARIVRESDGTIIKDSGRSSKLYVTKEEYEEGTRLFELNNFEPRPVVKTIKKPYTPMKKLREQYYTELQTKAYEEMQKRNAEPFNPVIEPDFRPRPAKRASNKAVENKPEVSESAFHLEYEIPRVRPARRAEDLVNEEIKEVTNDNIEVDTDGGPSENVLKEEVLKEIIEKNNNDWSKIVDEINLINNECTTNITDSTLEDNNEQVEECISKDNVELDEDNNCCITKAITEAIVKAANERNYYEYPEEDESEINTLDEIIEHVKENESYFYSEEDQHDAVFSEEMEADVFPEIANQGITIGTNLDKEIDYSNYVPQEEDEPELDENGNVVDRYYDLLKEDRKAKKRDSKKSQKPKTKKYVSDDMSDY